jgi:hypothetical protein
MRVCEDGEGDIGRHILRNNFLLTKFIQRNNETMANHMKKPLGRLDPVLTMREHLRYHCCKNA